VVAQAEAVDVTGLNADADATGRHLPPFEVRPPASNSTGDPSAFGSLLKNRCGVPSAALRGTRSSHMSRSLRAVLSQRFQGLK
jgi:hypothetical protein